MVSCQNEKPINHLSDQELALSLLRHGLFSDETPCFSGEVSAARWNGITRYYCDNGLAGFALQALGNLEIAIPDCLRAELKTASSRTAASNLHLEARFGEVARTFNQAGIDILALKGCVLTRQVYKRCDLRPMVDIDVMLRPEEALEGCRLFERMGYSKGADLLRPDFFPRFYYEVEYHSNEQLPVKFDVHARPFRAGRYRTIIPDDGFWHGAVRMNVGPGWVLVPSPERMLVHLCCHAALHGASRPLWLLDIKYYARTLTQIQWNDFLQLARRWNLAHPVLFAFKRAEAMFGRIVPGDIAEELECLPVSWKDRLTLWQAPRDAEHPLCHLAVDVIVGGGLRDRLAYLAAVAFPQRSHMRSIYPVSHPGWLICAHMWRVTRIPVRYLSSLVRRMQGQGVASRV